MVGSEDCPQNKHGALLAVVQFIFSLSEISLLSATSAAGKTINLNLALQAIYLYELASVQKEDHLQLR